MSTTKETSATLDDVVAQIQATNRLLAVLVNAVGNLEEYQLIELLASTSMPYASIGALLGKSAHTIENRMSEIRHRGDKPNAAVSKTKTVKAE